MKAAEFATITQSVIRKQGFSEFLPTVCFPERRDIRTLAGAPQSDPQESIATNWASKLAKPGEEYLVAFKHSAREFKIIRYVGTEQEHHVYAAEA